MKNMKKLFVAILALCLALALSACGGSPAGSASTTDAPSATSEPAVEDAAPTFSQSFEYEGVIYTIQDAGFFEEQKGYFETAGGDFNIGGATAWAGSSFSISKILSSTQYETLTTVAFTIETSLTGDELRSALDAFAAYLPLETGSGQSTSTRQLYEKEEGPVVCLLYSAADLRGADFSFFTEGGETMLVQAE